MKSIKYSDQELIQLIKENPDKLGIVYKKTKDYCIKFMRKINKESNINDSELDDIYHDAVMVLYEKITTGNFKLTASFQTYLNSVCRFQLLNKFKIDKKGQDIKKEAKLDVDNRMEEYDSTINDVLEPIPDQNELEFNAMEKAMAALKNAGGNCYELLSMFWYQKQSMKDLAKYFGYTNDKNAKSQKAKCQKRLKTLSFKYLNE